MLLKVSGWCVERWSLSYWSAECTPLVTNTVKQRGLYNKRPTIVFFFKREPKINCDVKEQCKLSPIHTRSRTIHNTCYHYMAILHVLLFWRGGSFKRKNESYMYYVAFWCGLYECKRSADVTLSFYIFYSYLQSIWCTLGFQNLPFTLIKESFSCNADRLPM